MPEPRLCPRCGKTATKSCRACRCPIWWTDQEIIKRAGELGRQAARESAAGDPLRCPACRAPVRIESDERETNWYVPLGPPELPLPPGYSRCTTCGAEKEKTEQ